MGWLNRETPNIQGDSEKRDFPSGIWNKCPKCLEVLLLSDLEENQKVCPSCGYHHRITVAERIEMLVDTGLFFEWDHQLKSTDPLQFNDGRSYAQRLVQQHKKTQCYDAVVTGLGYLQGRPIGLGVQDFFWMGGSMGTVVGERLYRLFMRCTQLSIPAIVVACSGGARMHEGLISLMQMAKVSAAIGHFKQKGLPFISIITDPTTGGVAASFAMLGDLNIAEPGATIGFAGRRVIEGTIGQSLPDDFQTSEFCLEHGILDHIVKRRDLKLFLHRTLNILLPQNDNITQKSL